VKEITSFSKKKKNSFIFLFSQRNTLTKGSVNLLVFKWALFPLYITNRSSFFGWGGTPYFKPF
jgi:hypothetical protein